LFIVAGLVRGVFQISFIRALTAMSHNRQTGGVDHVSVIVLKAASEKDNPEVA
jgi:hypothetical protein